MFQNKYSINLMQNCFCKWRVASFPSYSDTMPSTPTLSPMPPQTFDGSELIRVFQMQSHPVSLDDANFQRNITGSTVDSQVHSAVWRLSRCSVESSVFDPRTWEFQHCITDGDDRDLNHWYDCLKKKSFSSEDIKYFEVQRYKLCNNKSYF